MAISYRTDAGENIIEHLAGVEDYQVAMATYLAACQRRPGAAITLRQGTRVIEDSRRTRLVYYLALAASREPAAEHEKAPSAGGAADGQFRGRDSEQFRTRP